MKSVNSNALLLDADTQTEEAIYRKLDDLPSDSDSSYPLSNQVSQVHVDIITRVNELEIQNQDILAKLNHVCPLGCIPLSLQTLQMTHLITQFKQQWDQKNGLEREADVLLRKIGILS
jgi:hypothetical protein